MLLDQPPTAQRYPQLRSLVAGGLVLVALVAMELWCARLQLSGPTAVLLRSYVFAEPGAPAFYCALVLTLVLMPSRARWWAVGAAVLIDTALGTGRLLLHGSVGSVGAGALIVLTALAGYTVVRLRGIERLNALRGLACGGALAAATIVGNVWLSITARTRPLVFDEYVEIADRALGRPSWVMGEALAALGPPGHYLFLAVYSMLPLAAVLVAVVQLRRGWLTHNVMVTFIVLGIAGPLIYLLFPVVGPAYAFGSAGGQFALSTQWPHQFPAYSLAQAFPFDNFTPRNCVPSLHTAWAVILFVHTRPMGRWMRAIGAFWLGATVVATLGFGYHYGFDLVVGTIFALTVEAAMQSRTHGWHPARVQFVAGGASAVVVLLVAVRYGSGWIGANPALVGVLILAILVAVLLGYWRLTESAVVARTVRAPIAPERRCAHQRA